ncbi:hypothetical protein LVJ82_02460 [Vitreoscilla massiliensis]|uniref:Uncharacterized protein n=1 Tax=Vitreoscilla massiliensis TaxID=1689272 RepID=A0ABY4E3A7_9NEIS|nr:hypothetical protein [Vitreoscilla massiliensis]UOO89870.1 hypothetical protein LVJ82_02460 [Vitreoscilla massiliensis]
MYTHTPLPHRSVSTAQVDMELMFLSEHSQEHCLNLIMQLDADSRGPYLQQFVHQHAQLNVSAERRYHSVMEWLMAA